MRLLLIVLVGLLSGCVAESVRYEPTDNGAIVTLKVKGKKAYSADVQTSYGNWSVQSKTRFQPFKMGWSLSYDVFFDPIYGLYNRASETPSGLALPVRMVQLHDDDIYGYVDVDLRTWLGMYFMAEGGVPSMSVFLRDDLNVPAVYTEVDKKGVLLMMNMRYVVEHFGSNPQEFKNPSVVLQ